ncbi:MAG: ATP-binding protein, partial [Lacunisphaera sp.]
VMAMADPGMLDQVLMNLTVNARDAMPVGGLLTLATDLVMLSASDLVRFPESKPGPHVCLRVMDTGCGIAPEIISRIFEPFFTTKDPGKGTGLGLATVFGIVRQHGGSIGVSSELGHGTTFEILLPAADTGSAQPAPIKKIELPRGAGETVLVVEDAAAVRRFAARVLESHGYRVLEAGSGQEALLLFANSGARPDLLLTDMILPAGLTGRELADRLRAEVPAMRTLFMSGYPAGGSRPGLNLQEGINFLAKPFQADALLLCVRARLDSPV